MAWGSATLGSMLDERSAKIRADLDEAQALRDEALAELKTISLHREAVDEAKAIVKSGETTAERIRETAEKESAPGKTPEQQADAKIKAAEASMVAELRDRAASLAIATVQKSFRQSLMTRPVWPLLIKRRLKSKS